ncbi:MAG: 3-hydroxyacyl-[acyl-carrier-protein] dehydratase FabZ [Phycisphaerae bacterium]|nr:3-hydroxyacyl-[acyl-carrier-protein] dehydratase FabZ [Phycisphaerae bacterium]
MPAQSIVDLAALDFDHPIATIEGIRKVNPHRFEFEQLTAIIHDDPATQTFAAYREVREDEFWVRGHIPGRPIMPGVLIIESAAQMCSYFIKQRLEDTRFVGFGGVEAVKFRGQVIPPSRLVFVGKMLELRPRRAICDTQAFVDGKMVFEGRIIGMPL